MGAGEEVEPIRVLVADDHSVYRRGLRTALTDEGDIEVVGEASHGIEAVERAADLKPHVVILDAHLPRRSGTEACRRIRELLPQAKIIIMIDASERSTLVDSVQAGASGYLDKDVSVADAVRAVRAVRSGRSVLPVASSWPSSQPGSKDGAAAVAPQAVDDDDKAHLTSREAEVLELIALGKSNVQVSRTLHIADNTVKSHVANIFTKLGVGSRVEAATLAIRMGVISVPCAAS